MNTVLIFIAMISCTVIANLLMKTGASASVEKGSLLDSFLDFRTIAGLASFAAAAILYVMLLRRLPLNVAQSFMSAQFVAVILASALVLGEHIAPVQWIGIGLIAAGIVTVGWSQG